MWNTFAKIVLSKPQLFGSKQFGSKLFFLNLRQFQFRGTARSLHSFPLDLLVVARSVARATRSVGFGLPLGFISRPTSVTGEAHNLSLSISLSLSLSLSSSQNLTFVSFCESRGYFPRPKKNRPNSKFV